MMARMDAWLTNMKDIRKETMACLGKTEARLGEEEPASEDMELEAAHEVPVEDAARMPVGEPRNRCRIRRHLAAQRLQKKQQERTQSKNGCRKDLVAARRGTDDPSCSGGTTQEIFFSQRTRLGNIANPARNWPQPAERSPDVHEWHGARDIITKDRRSNRDDGRIRPGPSYK
jgi:hypothetical protein